jgi:hypothetical protein
MAAGSAAERAEAKGRASARKRGREVCLPVPHLLFCTSLLYFTLPLLLPKPVSCACSQICWLSLHLCLLLHVRCLISKWCGSTITPELALLCMHTGPCCLIAIELAWQYCYS